MDINTEFIRRFKILQLGMVRKELKAIRMVFDYSTELYTKKIFENPDKYVWMSLFIPSEILYAMDLVLLECDFSGGWLCTFGFAEKLLNYAEQELGIGQVCSFHKTWIAGLHNKLLPPPKAIVATHYTCDSAQQAANYVHETFGTEYFLLDIPRIKSKESINYIKKQLIELTSFLSDVTGSKFDLEKLKKAVHNSNTATNYWKKAQELRTGRPLLEGLTALRYIFTCWMLCGSEEYVKIAKTLYDELKERSRNNTKILEERCRLMWIHLAPYYITKMEALNKIERSLGAPIVMDAFSYPYYDHINEEDPFLGLAEKISASPYMEIERSKNEYFLKLAKKYRINGVILLLPMGCRVWYGFSRMLEDSFRDLGIPTLHLDVDTVDSRQYSDSQAKTRVEAFVESLLHRQHG